MNKLYVGLLILASLTSCSDKEKREKALKDLDATQQTLIDVNNEVSNLERELTKTIGELEVAKDDINQVKEFQLLRTEAEREQQIRNATEYKLKIEENIETIKSNIEYFKDSANRTEKKIAGLKEFLKN
jgi:predicted  nucleic acid-binding Zn-ribbon protein